MKIRTEQVINESDWSQFVTDVYGRPYSFQQQAGCRDRGSFRFSVPDTAEDFDNDSVPENVNDSEMGVSFAAWLARDPKQKLSNPEDQSDSCLALWWQRNFYPDIQMLANDLHAKGLLAAGKYTINIDW